MIKKFRFYKGLLREIIETLCTICLYLESEAHYSQNRQGNNMRLHFEALKEYSNTLGKEMEK